MYIGATEAIITVHAAAGALPEPTTDTDGASLDELRVGHTERGTARHYDALPESLVLYGYSDGAAATVPAPELRVYRDGRWYPVANGALNGGLPIVGSYSERIAPAGDWERVAIYSPGPITNTMTFELVGDVRLP